MRILPGETLLVATGNAGKMAEISALLSPFGVSVVGLADFGLAEPEETELSFSGNALLKARAAAKGSGLVTLADDSGLMVEALGGAPGIYTADWAEGAKGRDFGRAMAKTWGLLEGVRAKAPRSAAFCCTLALVRPGSEERVFEGRVAGQIVWPKRGTRGHGYDPIFVPDGYEVTFGEMDEAVKNRISHRADAFGKLMKECFT
jgi:XTP/dITP diphosphohydrolase